MSGEEELRYDKSFLVGEIYTAIRLLKAGARTSTVSDILSRAVQTVKKGDDDDRRES